MPSTVNGIGTHYYGKSNHTARVAACKSCQRVGNLESYDTRLWFVIVFIPIIPLGRKRIIDKCPSCSRHYAMEADMYEQTKQLQTSGSLERYRREPSADSAMAAHGQLLAFHELDQAAEFRQAALSRLPDHAGLRAAMAMQLREMSSFDESAELFPDALALDPGLPDARVGVAQSMMGEGRLDEALVLLDFLTEPGQGQQSSLLPIDILAGNFQRAGDHEQALSLAEALSSPEHPEVADDHVFRAFIRRSEKAIARPGSILPERGFSLSGLFRSKGSPYAPWQRRLAIGGIAASLLLGGLAINNESIRRHRTLRVLNATGQPARVSVDGQPAVPVLGMAGFTLPEGSHVIKVSGPVEETHTIALDSGYLERWTSNPAWILNLGGEGVLEEVNVVYSANGTPSRRHLVVGETFFHRPHVDYLFTSPPDSLELKNKNQDVTKIAVDWAQGKDLNAFLETIETDHEAAMDFAEKRLRRSPNQAELLDDYMVRCLEGGRDRVERFLRSGLDRRPVVIPWHRAFQTVAELNKHETELLPLYDKYLEAEPSNAAFLYLRGRVDPDWDQQESYYQRAIAADPKLGWPWLALAARASSEGKWDDCLQAALEVRKLRVEEPGRIAELLHEARMAKGEAKALVAEYRAGTNANVHDAASVVFLVDALAASGDEGEIEPAIQAWTSRLPGPLQGQIAPQLRALGLYYAGNLEACADFCASGTAVKSSPMHLQALIALGRMEEATDPSVFGTLFKDPIIMLAVSVGFGLDGKPEESAHWREEAVSALIKLAGATEYAKLAKLLGAREAPSIEAVRRVYSPPSHKAIVLAALADQYPAGRQVFLAEAARFNNSRKPPYQLIRRATAGRMHGHP